MIRSGTPIPLARNPAPAIKVAAIARPIPTIIAIDSRPSARLRMSTPSAASEITSHATSRAHAGNAGR